MLKQLTISFYYVISMKFISYNFTPIKNIHSSDRNVCKLTCKECTTGTGVTGDLVGPMPS